MSSRFSSLFKINMIVFGPREADCTNVILNVGISYLIDCLSVEIALTFEGTEVPYWIIETLNSYCGIVIDLKAPYSSKIEKFNKFIYSINTIIKCGI